VAVAGERPNAVEFEYFVKTDDIEFGGYNFRLIIKTDGRTRAFLSGTVKESGKVYSALAAQLGGTIAPQPKAAKAGISAKTATVTSGQEKIRGRGKDKGPDRFLHARPFRRRQGAIQGGDAALP
jgi:hypothetical protein